MCWLLWQTHNSNAKICQEEIEMEDIVEEPIVDIDSWDAKNPLAVVEYVEDLFSYYRKMEVNICLHLL